jgi:hypothetical protein
MKERIPDMSNIKLNIPSIFEANCKIADFFGGGVKMFIPIFSRESAARCCDNPLMSNGYSAF